MSIEAAFGSIVAAAAATAVMTQLAMGYARRRALIDVPGRRRSHSTATLRGGGIAIVTCMLAALLSLAAWGMIAAQPALWCAAAMSIVAAVGWLDDHRSQSASLRLAVHAAAALMFAPILGLEPGAGPSFRIVVPVVHAFLLISAVNVWNFMDGINGLVTSQSAWVAAIAGIALATGDDAGWALAAAALTGACLGFLPFNFPRARIFLGDVGSGALGFVCVALLLVAVRSGVLDYWQCAMVTSALLIDASLTLLSRMFAGRRWYTAHREHLYQWLVRSGRSHARVTTLYLLWNAIVVLPALGLAQRWPDTSVHLCATVLALGAGFWFMGRRSVLNRVRRRSTR